MKDWIQTYTGRKFHPLNPDLSQLDWEDMAHALANLCRYTGHTRKFYSVAQHAVLVSRYLEKHPALVHSQYAARWGLIHDNSEAYLNDLSRPVKRQAPLAEYREAESNLQKLIAVWAGLGPNEPDSVKYADMTVYVTEVRDLMSPVHPDWRLDLAAYTPLAARIRPWSPAKAKREYLKRARELGWKVEVPSWLSLFR